VLSESLLARTLADLEWGELAAAVSERRRLVVPGLEPLPLAHSFEATRTALAETREAHQLISDGEPLPLDGLRDVGQQLLRVERHGDLDAPQINEVRTTLAAARVLRKFLTARKQRVPALFAACPIDPTLDRLTDLLDGSFDPDGTLADHASFDLKRLRQETRNLRATLVSRLEELIHKHRELLSDAFYTVREGRYVLPVRSDTHERVHGIVHGASASGATIFVEPRSLVLSGNRLKLAEAEQEREEARVLAALSSEIRDAAASVRGAFEALLHADLRAACARFSRELDLEPPTLIDAPRIRLKGARHPMLLMRLDRVVPNDVSVDAQSALVISGPNAGGKTVALKLLGLSALMVRAGLFLPAEAGSECGFFTHVLSDIGDEQSLVKSLSTFSAHINHVREILELSGEGALVLLDELAGSTDPEEGAALACAIVERLIELGAAVGVTTHYEPLKARALVDPRFRNASVGFDVAQMAPTFRLRLDVPGASSALRVAERFGLSHGIVERARALVPEQSQLFERLVGQLQSKLGAADAAADQLEGEVRAARTARSAIDDELARLKARDRRALSGEATKAIEELRELRSDMQQLKKSLRRDVNSQDAAREAAKRLDAVAEKLLANKTVSDVRDGGASTSDEPGEAPAELAVGQRVFVPRLRAEADIIEGPSKGKVRVAAGPLRLWVDVADTRELKAARAEPPPKAELVRSARPVQRSVDNTLVLRGMRVDDALTLLDGFLDRMYGRDESVAYVDHGVGSGALRDAVREHLRRPSPYVREVRPGAPDEGGERLTVVLLR
jgi:DNA mismatch repair protein MutS2